MGHIRLGVLPKYPKWKDVIGLLGDSEAHASQVADKVLINSKEILQSESALASVGYCIWLIAQLTRASRSKEFKSDLIHLNIQVTESTTATEFLAMTSRVTERHLSNLIPHTAINNIAGLALRESLTRTIGTYANTLFGAGLTEIQFALKRYSTQQNFGDLLHGYFTSFLRRTMMFILDKETSNHLGPGRRFSNIQVMGDFELALGAFASQTARIIQTFSGGWYSKRSWQQGYISHSDAVSFAYVALKKVLEDINLSQVQ